MARLRGVQDPVVLGSLEGVPVNPLGRRCRRGDHLPYPFKSITSSLPHFLTSSLHHFITSSLHHFITS
ncbi:MAG TPA: hypothetical protein PKD45_04970, partial [Flavobacteriales bacterium]|nr:hypothetical protein [Flavobacteriales bacterium]